jgi:ech hydrogenase subunit A
MTILIFCLFAIPGAIYVFTKNKSKRVVPAYISGVNRQGGRAFYNSYGDERHMELSNWYMEDIFGERKLLKPVNIISTIMVIVALASVIILALI